MRLISFLLITLFCLSCFAQVKPFGQTIQVQTRFKSIIESPLPTWTLIVRDVNTGIVTPYLFDIRENDNFWVAFTVGHAYRITASRLKFGHCAVINNFCHLENGIIDRHSYWVHLTGQLTPDPKTFKCIVKKYKD